MELIPGPETDPTVVERMKAFAEKRLGKGVVIAKDVPNFIGNRMFSYIQSSLLEFAINNGYSVEEVDQLTGPLIGRPKTATFRLLDVVGVDVAALVGENLYALIPGDTDRDTLRGPLGTAALNTLLKDGLLGVKSGQGFYKTVRDGQGQRSFWGLDLQTAAAGRVDYVEPVRPSWASVDAVKEEPLPERLRLLVAPPASADDSTAADDSAGALLWHTFSRMLAYASKRLPEIADSPRDIDNAMKWGFGWEMGPFETWDALGVATTTERMAEEGLTVAPWVQEMLDGGHTAFYKDGKSPAGGATSARQLVYNPQSGEYQAADESEKLVSIAALKRGPGALAENDAASLLDMGDGVLLLEFHTKMNALDMEIGAIANTAIERLHGDAAGLVIGNPGGQLQRRRQPLPDRNLGPIRSGGQAGRGHQRPATDDPAAAHRAQAGGGGTLSTRPRRRRGGDDGR